jgi:hypothetical protein
MVGEIEHLLEIAGRDATMQQLALVPLVFAADHGKAGALLRDLNLGLLETGNRHADAVLVVTELFDVVGRPIRPLGVEQIEERLKADRGPS